MTYPKVVTIRAINSINKLRRGKDAFSESSGVITTNTKATNTKATIRLIEAINMLSSEKEDCSDFCDSKLSQIPFESESSGVLLFNIGSDPQSCSI